MQNTARRSNLEPDETQFAVIRDLMLEASKRGDWLTLAEIAESTEFGEASISAQLRHMRKVRFGNYRVDKRRRELLMLATSHTAGDGTSDATAAKATADSTTGTPANAPTDWVAEKPQAPWIAIGCQSEQWESRQQAQTQGACAPWEYRAYSQMQTQNDRFFEGPRRDYVFVEERPTNAIEISPRSEMATTGHLADCEVEGTAECGAADCAERCAANEQTGGNLTGGAGTNAAGDVSTSGAYAGEVCDR